MNNLNRNPEKHIVLEDLLKLKRQEKPDQAFWDNFNKQLHEKTLQELVYSRPSIASRLSNLFTVSFFKPALSACALAVLTLTLFTYNNSSKSHSQSGATLVKTSFNSKDDILVSYSSAQKNFVKNNISAEPEVDCNYANMFVSPFSSSDSVRYLAGNLASVNLGNSIVSNTIY